MADLDGHQWLYVLEVLQYPSIARELYLLSAIGDKLTSDIHFGPHHSSAQGPIQQRWPSQEAYQLNNAVPSKPTTQI